MASRAQHFIVHPAQGTLNTTAAPTLLEPGELVVATNVEHLSEGSRRKRLGCSRYNATAITGATTTTALADFWRYGTSLTPTQKFVAHSGTVIYKDDGDGVWDSIKTAWGTNTSEPIICTADDFVVFLNGVDTPQKWDQTTVSDLSTTTTAFAGMAYHLRRGFLYAEPNNPSQVLVTAASDITLLTGGDTLSIQIDEGDGDRVMWVGPWRSRLFALKGPQFGSVHQVTGQTLSTLVREKVSSGAPCASIRSVIVTPNDIFWASQYGFHSLLTTQKYGDTEEYFISKAIQTSFNNLSPARLNQIVGFYHPNRNIIGWTVPENGQTQNNLVFVYNFVQGRWAIWDYDDDVASCKVMLDPQTRQPRLYMGGYDGFVREGDQSTLTDDNGQPYSARIRTPVYTKMPGKDELTEASFHSVTTIFKPKGNYNADLTVTIDGRDQTATVNLQGGGAVLGSFTLSTSVLGGGAQLQYIETPIEDRGRSIQLQWVQGGGSQDLELFGHGIRYTPAETHALERS